MGIFDFLQEKRKVETVTDVDGNDYTTIKIGKQIWTVENLKTTKYNDGTAILLAAGPRAWSDCFPLNEPAYCWYDDDKSKNEKYGALYNWYAVNTGKLAPKGWHVPTHAEWTELVAYLIANGYNCDGSKEGNKIAKALAAKTEWTKSEKSESIGNHLRKNNTSGFSALPGGCRYHHGDFDGQCGYCGWWSATESNESNAYNCALGYGLKRLGIGHDQVNAKGDGYSVRLVRDN